MMNSGILGTADLTALAAPAPGHSPRPALMFVRSGWSLRSWPQELQPRRASAPLTTSRRRGRPRGPPRAAPVTCPPGYAALTQVSPVWLMSQADESLWLFVWLLLSSHHGHPVTSITPSQSVLYSGSHIYIDAGEGLASEASLTAVITQAATWKIKV